MLGCSVGGVVSGKVSNVVLSELVVCPHCCCLLPGSLYGCVQEGKIWGGQSWWLVCGLLT